jgi:hypothetical protein
MIWLIVAAWLGSLALFVVLRSKATKRPPKAAPKAQIGHERRPPPRTVGSASPPEREAA